MGYHKWRPGIACSDLALTSSARSRTASRRWRSATPRNTAGRCASAPRRPSQACSSAMRWTSRAASAAAAASTPASRKTTNHGIRRSSGFACSAWRTGGASTSSMPTPTTRRRRCRARGTSTCRCSATSAPTRPACALVPCRRPGRRRTGSSSSMTVTPTCAKSASWPSLATDDRRKPCSPRTGTYKLRCPGGWSS